MLPPPTTKVPRKKGSKSSRTEKSKASDKKSKVRSKKKSSKHGVKEKRSKTPSPGPSSAPDEEDEEDYDRIVAELSGLASEDLGLDPIDENASFLEISLDDLDIDFLFPSPSDAVPLPIPPEIPNLLQEHSYSGSVPMDLEVPPEPLVEVTIDSSLEPERSYTPPLSSLPTSPATYNKSELWSDSVVDTPPPTPPPGTAGSSPLQDPWIEDPAPVRESGIPFYQPVPLVVEDDWMDDPAPVREQVVPFYEPLPLPEVDEWVEDPAPVREPVVPLFGPGNHPFPAPFPEAMEIPEQQDRVVRRRRQRHRPRPGLIPPVQLPQARLRPYLGWHEIEGERVYVMEALRGCFKCGRRHHYNQCHLGRYRQFCKRCGLRNVTLRSCTLCSADWRRQGPFVRRLGINVPWDEDLPEIPNHPIIPDPQGPFVRQVGRNVPWDEYVPGPPDHPNIPDP